MERKVNFPGIECKWRCQSICYFQKSLIFILHYPSLSGDYLSRDREVKTWIKQINLGLRTRAG